MDCYVCTTQFDNQKEKQPCILKCGHSFCRGCLSYIMTHGSPWCPLCEMRISDTNPDNLILNCNLLSIIISKSQCTPKKDEDYNVCNVHIDNFIKFFCKTCKQNICQKCILVNHTKKNCDIVSLSLRKMELKIETMRAIKEILSVSAKLKKYLSDNPISSLRTECNDILKRKDKEISESLDELGYIYNEVNYDASGLLKIDENESCIEVTELLSKKYSLKNKFNLTFLAILEMTHELKADMDKIMLNITRFTNDIKNILDTQSLKKLTDMVSYF